MHVQQGGVRAVEPLDSTAVVRFAWLMARATNLRSVCNCKYVYSCYDRLSSFIFNGLSILKLAFKRKIIRVTQKIGLPCATVVLKTSNLLHVEIKVNPEG